MTPPIFIVGAGRSGTKILRDCLGSASDVALIPYDVGYIWKIGNQNITHDELLPAHLDKKKRETIRNVLIKMGEKAYGSDEYLILLEKSVPNSLRPLFLKEIFPEAKLIHLVRDGRAVVESAYRNWQSPTDGGYFLDKLRYFPVENIPYAFQYAKNKMARFGGDKSSNKQLWGPHYDGMQQDANNLSLLEVCALQWLRCVETCQMQFDQLPSCDVLTIKYEDFVSQDQLLEAICVFAGITDNLSVNRFYDLNIRDFKPSSSFSSLDDQEQESVLRIIRSGLERFGYL